MYSLCSLVYVAFEFAFKFAFEFEYTWKQALILTNEDSATSQTTLYKQVSEHSISGYQ